LPKNFSPKLIVHDYSRHWCQRHGFRHLRSASIREVLEWVQVQIGQGLIDATVAPAKGGAAPADSPARAKGQRCKWWLTSKRFRRAWQQCRPMLASRRWYSRPERLIDEEGYESHTLDALLFDMGMEMFAPHRGKRFSEYRTRDGRSPRRYRNLWVVRRTIVYQGNHRRLLVTWGKPAAIYLGLTLLNCLMITLKHLSAEKSSLCLNRNFRTTSNIHPKRSNCVLPA
jgi:hypothetical protein